MAQHLFGNRTRSFESGSTRSWARTMAGALSALMLVLTATLVAVPAMASVSLRIEARPIENPIEAFISVTDETTGNPVGGLTAGDFTVTLDDSPLTIQTSDLTLPPAFDPAQRVSVIFVLDYSGSIKNTALATMENAVRTFIDSMQVGDYAAIIKFNNTNPLKASVVKLFTQIDDGANDAALKSVVLEEYAGSGTNLLDAIDLAVQTFKDATLPPGPKAIIAITDGGDNASSATQSTVVAEANGDSIPVFNIGVGNVNVPRLALLTDLATQTGGQYLSAPTDQEITAAYDTVSSLLKNEYLLSIPSSISDCATHTLEVSVVGHPTPVSGTFTRRECDMVPDAFSFTNKTNVDPDSTVNADPVTITGIEAAVPISITGGGYSVACTGNYTSSIGSISNGQTLCVRHTSDTAFSTDHLTTVTVGGVAATFKSTTKATADSSSGGGGSTGLGELLVCLAALAARQRRRA